MRRRGPRPRKLSGEGNRENGAATFASALWPGLSLFASSSLLPFCPLGLSGFPHFPYRHDIACVPCCRCPAAPTGRAPTSQQVLSLLIDPEAARKCHLGQSRRHPSWLPSDQTAPRRRRRRAATGRRDRITAEDPPPPPTSDWATASGRRSSSTWAFSPECRRSRLSQVRVLRDAETCAPSGCRQMWVGFAVAPKTLALRCAVRCGAAGPSSSSLRFFRRPNR